MPRPLLLLPVLLLLLCQGCMLWVPTPKAIVLARRGWKEVEKGIAESRDIHEVTLWFAAQRQIMVGMRNPADVRKATTEWEGLLSSLERLWDYSDRTTVEFPEEELRLFPPTWVRGRQHHGDYYKYEIFDSAIFATSMVNNPLRAKFCEFVHRHEPAKEESFLRSEYDRLLRSERERAAAEDGSIRQDMTDCFGPEGK